jgi:hypothetical protein
VVSLAAPIKWMSQAVQTHMHANNRHAVARLGLWSGNDTSTFECSPFTCIPRPTTPGVPTSSVPLTTPPPLPTPPPPPVSGKFIDEFKMACGTDAKASLKHMMGHVHSFVTAACK